MEGIILILVLLCVSTCIIEIIPFLFLKNRFKWIKTSLLCNVITNPIMNTILAILTLFIRDNTVFFIITVILEVAVVVFEAFIYYNVMDESAWKCVVLSLLANVCSFAIGVIFLEWLEIFEPPVNKLDRINPV